MEVRFHHSLICLLLAVSSLGSCLVDEPVTRDDPSDQTDKTDEADPAEPEDTSEPEGPPEPTVITYTLGTPVEYSTGVDGTSAICLNEAENGFLVAEDNGHILEFDFEGNKKATHDVSGDWEGIARAPDGSIYLCEERTREVYKLSADHKSVTLVSQGPNETEEDGYVENQGYEGIAAGPGVLYVANQSGPKRVYVYTIATGKWETAFDAPWATSLSDIYYDVEDATLWITDAKTHLLTHLQTDGTVLQNLDISFVNKPEGFCKDTAHKLFWFVCDKKKKIHKVSYN